MNVQELSSNRSTRGVHVLIASVSGLLVAVLQVLLPHGGYLPLLAFLIGLVGLPTSSRLSGRIGLNGVLLLGLLPILWWGTPAFSLSRMTSASSVASGIICAVVVYFSLERVSQRKALLPTISLQDTLLGASALFMLWLYLPYFTGASAVASLLQSLRGDIVAHFTMVVKTVETGVSGAGWGNAADGSAFVYVNYPQHFHTLAAYLGQSFTGNHEGLIEANASVFLAGTALVSMMSVIILSSLAVYFFTKTPGIFLPGLVVIAITASLSTGFGASNLQAGFPNFVLAAVGVLYVFFIAVNSQKITPLKLITASSGVLLVISSWFLLSPLALVLLVFVAIRLFNNHAVEMRRRILAISAGAVIVCVGYAWSLSLIFAASSGIGGPVNVLNVPGGTLSIPPRLVFALCIANGLFGVVLALLVKFKSTPALIVPSWGIILLSVFSTALLGGLILLQRIQGDTATYYQEKLANGIFLILTIVLVFACTVALKSSSVRFELMKPIVRWPLTVVCWFALFVALTANPNLMNGFQLSAALSEQTQSMTASTKRLLLASEQLEAGPCTSPVYLALVSGDPSPDIANQWAHAMSGTWTESSGPINTFLANHSLTMDYNNPGILVQEFLADFPDTCVIVSPEILESIRASNPPENSGRIHTW